MITPEALARAFREIAEEYGFCRETWEKCATAAVAALTPAPTECIYPRCNMRDDSSNWKGSPEWTRKNVETRENTSAASAEQESGAHSSIGGAEGKRSRRSPNDPQGPELREVVDDLAAAALAALTPAPKCAGMEDCAEPPRYCEACKDHGIITAMALANAATPPPPEPEGEVQEAWRRWAEEQPECKAGRPLIATHAAFCDAYRLGYNAALARARRQG